jgi:hypothetical protein
MGRSCALPKGLQVQGDSTAGGSQHRGRGGIWEAFFPDGNPYLGQAVLGEPLYQANVLSPTGDASDEPSIRRARRPLPVIILRIQQPG